MPNHDHSELVNEPELLDLLRRKAADWDRVVDHINATGTDQSAPPALHDIESPEGDPR